MKDQVSWDSSLGLWPERQVESGRRMLGDKAGQGRTRLLITSCHVEEFRICSLVKEGTGRTSSV